MTRHKFHKELYTHRTGGELPGIVVAAEENLQSKFIVQKALELREQGVPLNDIAVLFRSSFHSFDLEIELNKANVPFVKFGGFRFVETAHIKDLVAYLRVLENPKDAVAWNRILLLVEGVGPRTAEKVLDDLLARRVGAGGDLSGFWSGYPALAGSRPDRAGTDNAYPERLRTLFETLGEIAPERIAPADKVETLLNYYQPIFTSRYDDHTKRRKDLEMFQQITERYRSLGTFLSDISLEPATESITDITPVNTDDEKLILSTIHSAKGLEWNTVFVIYALEGRFPNMRAASNDDAMEEERRLMYVACTRAKEHLFITYPINVYDRESGLVLSKPSRFIAGLPENLLEAWVVDEE